MDEIAAFAGRKAEVAAITEAAMRGEIADYKESLRRRVALLAEMTDDVAALKAKCDYVVASCHWGLHQDVLDYMPQIAHAAIDAGADVVIGHGPHYSLPVEVYKGKPVYYGLGSFSFHT